MTEVAELLTPNTEDIQDKDDANNAEISKKRKPGRPKNNVFIEVGARVQGYCGAKCKECGWEKKANAKSEELETHIGFRCIKASFQLKE